jgi:hypothetical protein
MSSATKYVIAFAIIFILLALFALVLRRLTGNRTTLAGERGRTRQPRLGIVDVYDLDRQRQLILLRRDNVEHLLLVGGPNDVVVETNIVRVAGARLPAAAAEVIERLDERTVEIAPIRPVVEPALPRPNEGAIAAHLGNLETAVASAALEQVAAPTAPAESPAAAAPRPEPVRPEPVRPEPRPVPQPRVEPDRPARPAAVMPDVRTGPRPAAPPLSRANPTPPPAMPPNQPAARESAAERPVFTDMAQQLEEALRRSPPSTPEPSRTAPGQAEPRRAAANGGGQPEPVPAPNARPTPPRPVEAAPAPRPPTAPIQVAPPPPLAPTSPPAPPSPPASASPPAPPKPPAPARQPAPASAQPPAPPPPEPANTRDPFSIEDIEAEFARLLGRPLDRR